MMYPEPRTLSCSLCFSSSDETFDLGLRFELVVEVRPRVASGVLLHVRTAEGYFTVYIHQGAVSRWYSYPGDFTHLGQVMLIKNASSVQKYGYTFGVCSQVVVLVNDGSHEFFTKVSPKQGLCAGNWHRITGENFLINSLTPMKEMIID